MTVILGSSSPSRKEVLEAMGFEFSIISPDIDDEQSVGMILES
ncbi:MAG: Maf family protein [Patescibacteria group bacterium]